jgi:2'-5' RNA ligase
VELPDLKQLYSTIDWHNSQEDFEEGSSVGVFIVLPDDIAEQYPEDGKEGEDSSPPHITAFYIGMLPSHFNEKALKTIYDVAKATKPFHVKLSKPKKFQNDYGQTIWHSPVVSKRLKDFNAALKHAFMQDHVPFDNKWPEFKPHVTIEYVDEGEKARYRKVKPAGKWKVDTLWVWGMNEPHLIPLGK